MGSSEGQVASESSATGNDYLDSPAPEVSPAPEEAAIESIPELKAEAESINTGAAPETATSGTEMVENAKPAVQGKEKKKKKVAIPLTEDERVARRECLSLCHYVTFLFLFTFSSYLARGDEQGYYMVQKLKDEILYNEFETGAK